MKNNNRSVFGSIKNVGVDKVLRALPVVLALFMSFATVKVEAQCPSATAVITNYTFSTGVGTASDWLTPTNTYASLVTGDDAASSLSNLGFTFTFEGTPYTQFSVNTNGQLRLGSTVISGSYYSTPFSTSYVAYNYPKIIGIGADLVGTTLSYGVSGSAPNRIGVFTYYGYRYGSSGNPFYFKVYLYEATGEIKIVYNSAPATVPSGFQIGIEGANTSDVVTVNPSTHAKTNGATSTTYSVWPGQYRYYSFMPPVLSCPGIYNLAVAGSTVTWLECGTATQWEVEYGPQGFTQGTGTRVTVNNTPTYTLAGLTAGTVYDVYVRSVCGNNDYSSWKKTSLLYGATFCGGNGTQADPYRICSEQDLRDLATYVNMGVPFNGIYFRQMVNITMTQGVFTPVGATPATPFRGTYYGGNHSINTLVMANNTSPNRGLFGTVIGGYIDSLTIDGNISGGDSTGAIAGSVINSTVRHCTNNAYVSGAAQRHGGIVGAATNSLIEYCVNNGALTGAQYYHGGIVGVAGNGTIIRGCVNNGILSNSSQYYTGGIVGYISGNSASDRSEIHSCVNNGNVVGYYYTGGVAGQAFSYCIIDSSINKTSVNGSGYYCGGIVGDMRTDNIVRRCVNRGTVTSASGYYTGGIVGYSYGTSSSYNYIEYCCNANEVTSGSLYNGGIAGYLYYTYCQYNSNSGDVICTSTSSYTGGICGYNTTGAYVRYNLNGGLVTSNGNYVGGISGYNVGGSSYLTNNLNVNNVTGGATYTNKGAISGYGAGTTNYYDEQMCPTTMVYGTTAASTENKTTNDLVLGATVLPSATYFTRPTGLYPIPNGITGNMEAKLAATPIFLVNGENVGVVQTNFTVGTNNNVSWQTACPLIISITGQAATLLGTSATWCRMTGATDSIEKHINVRPLSMPTFCGGSGTQADPYLICNPATLDSLADFVNLGINCAGLYFKVVRDLDMSGFNPWNPIGATAGTPFAGHFDGNNKVISNVTINTTTQYQGLFGYVLGATASDRAEIHHLVLRGSITGGSYTGGIVGYANYTKLYNLKNYATIANTSYTYHGGILGYGYYNCSIDSCENYGTVQGSSYTGGVAGGIYYYGSVRNSGNFANVTASSYSAGVIGYPYYYDTIVNCRNEGNVSSTSCYVGGIAGYKYYYGYIQGCANTGDVTGTYGTGGIVGYMYYQQFIQNCTNSGDVSGSYYVGGIAGYYYSGQSSLTSIYEIRNCTNSGDITGSSYYVGGISGYTGYCRVRFCNNYGDVDGSSYGVGGIAGYMYYYGIVSGCNNYGDVSSTYTGTSIASAGYGTGGIVGCFNYGTTVSNTYVIDSCNNYGDVTSTAYMTGGIVGEKYYYCGSARKCNNYGNVRGTNYVGGITGFHQGTSTSTASYAPYILSCANAGNVSGSDYVGGIVGRNGYTSSGYNAYTQECANIGSVRGTNYVGGICGYNYGYSSYPAYVRGCINSGSVTATNYAGGISGYTYSSSNAYTQYNINAGYVNCSGAYKGGIDGYSYAPTGSYFDSLMCPMPNWYYNNNSATYASRTSYLTNGSFNPSATYFTTEAGMYPRPTSLVNNTIAILAATPVFLDETNPTNHVDNVNTCFNVGTLYNVNWHSSNPLVANITGNVGVPLGVDTVTAIAVKDSVRKVVPLNITALPQVSATFTYNPVTLNDTTGRQISIMPATTQYSNGCTFFCNNLPEGLSINPSTGEISGIVYSELHDTMEVRAVCSGCFIAQALIPYNIFPEAPCMYDSLRLPAGFAWYYDSTFRFPVANSIVYADQRPLWVYTTYNGHLQPYLVQPKPTPMAHISGDTTICAGESARLMVVFSGTAPYYYRISGDTQDRVSNSDTAYITVSPTASTYYHLTYLRFEVCEAIPGNLTGRALVNICGEQNICNGDSVVFTSGTWFTNSSYTNPVQGNVAHPTTTTMYYNSLDGSSLKAVVYPRPTATIPTGSDSICDGGCVNILITFTGTAPFHFRLTGDTVDRVCNSNSTTLRLCPSGSIVYRILSLSDVYCEGQYQDRNGVYDVKVCTSPIICVGDSVVLPTNKIWFYDRFYTRPVGGHVVTPTTTTTYYTPAISYDDTATFSSCGSSQQFVVPFGIDTVTLQVWGAQGGDGGPSNMGGRGGFSEGRMAVTGGDILYVNVGCQGHGTSATSSGSQITQGGWNGGGNGYENGTPRGGGGGATDIRVGSNSLYARVIVAGGGGGNLYFSGIAYTAGHGGGTSGVSGTVGTGGTQTSAGNNNFTNFSNPAFGVGASATISGSTVCGGGGGWYGGGSGNSAGGGSGYVYTSSTASNYPSGCLLTPSRYLSNARTVAGNTAFPAPNGGTETGHSGDGFARIIYYSDSILFPASSYTVTVNPKPTATIHGMDTTCDSMPARVLLTFTGTAPFTYRLTGDTADRVSYNYSQILYLTPDTLSTYRLTMLHDGNCVSGRAQFTGIGIVYRCGQMVVCAGDSVSLPQGYYWYSDRNLTRRMYITDLLPRRTVTYFGVPIRGGQTYELTIVIKPHPTARFINRNLTSCNGDSAYLQIVFAGTAPYTYRLTGDVADRMSWYDTAVIPLCPSQTSRYNVTMLHDTLCDGIIPLPENEATVEICGQRVVCQGDTVHLPLGTWFYDSSCTRPVPSNNIVTIDSTTTFYLAGEMAYDFSYTGSTQTFQVPQSCYALKFEVWGAQGGYRSSSAYGGKGGYSVGSVNTIGPWAGRTLYVNVGGFGGNSSTNAGSTTLVQGGWNGGGSRYGYKGGGGGTDISLQGTAGSAAFDTPDHWYSRIIVAGGGGSDGASSKPGKVGGGLTGESATENFGSGGGGATQTAGGTGGNANPGTFGKGGTGLFYADGYAGAGGGGWYGGGGSYPDGSVDDDRGGGGGSGFVWSSATASNAPQNYTPTAAFYLDNAQTISGSNSFPDTAYGTETGHEGHGHARITVYSTGSYTVNVDRRPTGSISVHDTACGQNGVYVHVNFTGAAPFTYRITGDTADRVCYSNHDSVYVLPSMITAFRITKLFDNHCTADPMDYAGLATVEVCRQTMVCRGDTIFLDSTRNWFSDPLMLYPISRVQVPDTTTIYYTNTVRTHTAVVNPHPTVTILTPDTSICGGSACLRLEFTGTAPFTYRLTGDTTDRISYFNTDVACVSPENTQVFGVVSLYDAYCDGDPVSLSRTVMITVCDQRMVCAGDTVVLPAGSTWYYDGALTRPVPSNNIVTPTQTTSYYTESTVDFTYTGAVQKYVVPYGVTQLDLQVWGAEGGRGTYSTATSYYNGGKGGYSEGTLPVNPGDTLYVYVGGKGMDAQGSTLMTYPGGWNGGGDAGQHTYSSYTYQGGSGGGGTDIRVNSTTLGARAIVAGGGGGGAYSYVGGHGGGTAGVAGNLTGAATYYGQGGTQTGGGSGSTSGSAYGTNATSNVNGESGSFGQGGHGGEGTLCTGGAGGGGGWFGGGGGKSGSSSTCYPGGGGSGFVYTSSDPNCTLGSFYYMSNASTTAGNSAFEAVNGGTETGHSGNGHARIHGAAVYTVAVNTAPTASLSSGTTRICDSATNNAVNITINFTGTAPFTYRLTGDVLDRVANSSSETVTIYPTVSGIYEVVYLRDFYCEGRPVDLTGQRTVIVCDQPIICSEDQVTLPAGTWYEDVLLTRPVNGNTVSPLMTTTYYDQDTNAFTVTVRPRPSASISGRGNICNSYDSVSLTLRFTGTLPITYRLSGERFNRTATNYTEIVKVLPRRTTTYTVVSVSDVYCTGTVSDLAGRAVVTVCDTVTYCASDRVTLPAGLWFYDSLMTIPVGGNVVQPDSTTTYYRMLSGGYDTNFVFTGSAQSYTVPAGVDSVFMQVWGAEGGKGTDNSSNQSVRGGLGGYSEGQMPVVAGDVLYVYVGGAGQSSVGAANANLAGGFNGGGSTGNNSHSGSGGGSGGGASDIRVNSQSLYARAIVAGGGGGWGYSSESTAGDGGGLVGTDGIGTTAAQAIAGGGTQIAGGVCGGTYGGAMGGTGTFGQGGNGGQTGTNAGGGGGGGGWWGGAGGQSGNGNSCKAGGGGSGYVYTSATAANYPAGRIITQACYLTNAQTIAGTQQFVAPDSTIETGHSGNGYVRIKAIGRAGFEPYTVRVYPKPEATIYGGDSICFGQTTTLIINFTGVAPFIYRLNGESQNRMCNGYSDTVVVSPTMSTAYRLDMMYDQYCEARLVDLQGLAEVIVCDQPIICEGQAYQLDPNRVWYIDPMLTSRIWGASVTPTVTTTYYSAEGSFTVTVKPRPRATIVNNVVDICDSQTVSVVINFTGTPPFVYRLNGDTADRVCNNNMEILTFMPMGSHVYRMTSLYDALCDGTFLDMSGSVTANYCGEKVICAGSVVELPAGEPWFLDSACTQPVPSNSVMPNTTTTYYRHLGDTTINYSFIGDTQMFVVPSYLDSVRIQVWGAEGGRGCYSSSLSFYAGGKGGYAEGTLPVTPGDVLYILVGGKGMDATGQSTTGVAYPGGFNGGGSAGTHNYSSTYQGGSGGGATDIRVNQNDVNNRVIVAGGGGGGAYSYVGGYGGGTTGAAGNNTGAATYYGQGGTQAAGGSGSTSGSNAYGSNAGTNVNGQTGGFGYGGGGGSGTACTGGAGGGSGWYGGGGGKSGNSTTCYPGGGGSGFIWVAGATTPVTYAVPQAYYLNNARTVAGNTLFPDSTGNGNETGHSGNGFAKISFTRDLVESYTVIVNRGSSETFYDTIGYGESYNFCGVSYTRPGTYSANLYTKDGCDSTLILNLIMLDSLHKDTTIAICAFDSLVFRGTHYDSTGIYIDRKHYEQACDTIYTLNLTVKDTAFTYIDTVICSQDTFFVGDTMFNETGYYRQWLQTNMGCDSMVVLNLVVQDTIFNRVDSLACYETKVYFYGDTLDNTMPGTYTYVTQTTHGCDSVIIWNLTFRPRIETVIYDTFCENSRYFFNEEFRNASGTYYDTLRSQLCDCDSFVELHLTRLLYPVVELVDSGAYCKNDSLVLLVNTDANSIIWETYPVDTSMNRFRNQARIKVAPKVHTFYTVTVDHYPHNCVSTAQIYVKPPDTLQAIMRYSPSIVDLPNTQISFTDVSMGTLTGNKWVFDDKVVENTQQTYYTTAPDDDSIRVILIVYDTNTCSDTTEVIIPIRRGEIWIPNAFTPDNHDGNAANEVFKVSGLNIVEFEIHVYSRGGQLVYESTDVDGVWDGTHNGNKCLPGSYVYIVKYRLASHPDRLETKTGSILLIR